MKFVLAQFFTCVNSVLHTTLVYFPLPPNSLAFSSFKAMESDCLYVAIFLCFCMTAQWNLHYQDGVIESVFTRLISDFLSHSTCTLYFAKYSLTDSIHWTSRSKWVLVLSCNEPRQVSNAKFILEINIFGIFLNLLDRKILHIVCLFFLQHKYINNN